MIAPAPLLAAAILLAASSTRAFPAPPATPAPRTPPVGVSPSAPSAQSAPSAPSAPSSTGAASSPQLPAASLVAAGERLERLADALHVPGLAYAIVRGDEVLVAAHGLRDLASGEPMTTTTLLPLGSATRPFTAALAAMLVDDGTVWWDHPLARTIPGFTMVESTAAVQCSLRDVLCHRTGIMRTDLLWLGGAPSERVLQGFLGARPTAPFRERAQDESTGYLVAGLSLANSARSTQRPITDRLATVEEWETLLQKRLLAPLGMGATGLDRAPERPHDGGTVDATSAGRATGYALDGPAASPTARAVAPRPTASAGPAVGLRSNAEDISRFLRLMVDRGRLGDERLISVERIEELWRPQLAATPGASADVAVGAGMGWDVLRWNEQRLVRHEGGVEGFRVSMAVIPEQRIGLLLATNAAPPGLARRAERVVFSMLLGGPAPLAQEPKGASEGLVGRYRSALLGSEFEVREIDGTLQIEVSDGGLFDLEPPDGAGARKVVGIPDVVASFPPDADGVRRRMVLVQSGMPFDCPRLGVPPAPVDPAALREVVGVYLDPRIGQNVAITVAPSGRLALESRPVAGASSGAARSLPLEFDSNANRDRWMLAGPAGMALEAIRGDDGRVRGVAMVQPGSRTELLRIGELSGPSAGFFPESAEFLARHRAAQGFDALAAPRAMAGTIAFQHQNVAGDLQTTVGRDGVEVDASFVPYGRMVLVAGSGGSRIDASFDGPRPLNGAEADRWRMLFGLLPPTAWIAEIASLIPAGVEGPSDAPGVRYIVRTPAGAEAMLVIDANSGLARRLETEVSLGALGSGPMLVTYDGWRVIDGVALPARVLLDGPLLGRVEMRLER